MRSILHCTAVCVFVLLLVPGCSKDDPVAPVTGLLTGQVTDAASSAALVSVRVTLYNALTNNSLGTFATGFDGAFRFELSPGSYYVRLARQGYEPIPPLDIPPLPISVTAGATTDNSVQMFRSNIANGGAITGKVVSDGKPAAGVLVVAESGTGSSSGLSDLAGDYFLYNLPAASYTVKAWVSGLNSSQETIAVAAGTEQAGVNLTLTANQLSTVSGHVTFLATTNAEVDVALLNPNTREVVPGLTTTTSGGIYSIPNVPYGTYLARATYRNDGKVMDPDWIIKNGDPYVSVAAAAVTRDFSVTGAEGLASPTNPAASTQPVEVRAAGLTLTWSQYSSADNYVVEVTNQSGRVIWGGFGDNWTSRNVVLPKTQTSVAFNSDSTAVEPLTAGKVYRWKIYVSKNDAQEPLGWKLISTSEDQQGMIKIIP